MLEEKLKKKIEIAFQFRKTYSKFKIKNYTSYIQLLDFNFVSIFGKGFVLRILSWMRL